MKNNVTFLDLLGLLLIAFKLAGVIAWSWWAILCPLYVPWTLAFIWAFLVAFVKSKAASRKALRTKIPQRTQ